MKTIDERVTGFEDLLKLGEENGMGSVRIRLKKAFIECASEHVENVNMEFTASLGPNGDITINHSKGCFNLKYFLQTRLYRGGYPQIKKHRVKLDRYEL